MPLTEKELKEIALDEEGRWKKSFANIIEEIKRTNSDFKADQALARELTAQIVSINTRDEDKSALASDEAVAHGLSKLRKNKASGLENLAEEPYFARVITQEEGKQVEFKLGTASFPKERIIDWRKAPISRLYYDYKEGDEFYVNIQEQEREGTIKLRRAYKGREDQLAVIELPNATLHKVKDNWMVSQANEPKSRVNMESGHLPPILSLITPEQFNLITSTADKPMIIQGIAGSGKTTVALHRLSWLLHEDNSDCRAKKCLVVMFNRSLKAYVEMSLPELKLEDVAVRTYGQWANKLVTDIVGPRPHGQFQRSTELEQFKSSLICLEYIQKYVEKRGTPPGDYVADLFGFFAYLVDQPIFWPKWSKIKDEIILQLKKKLTDYQDDTLLLHLIYADHGHYPGKSPGVLSILDHIVVDEAQDFGVMEIRALLGALNHEKTVTIVGDIAQKIVLGRNFNSWEEVLRDAGFQNTTPIALAVSHRSTVEIMQLAGELRTDTATQNVPLRAVRHGPTPSFIKAESDELLAHSVGQWIAARQKENSRVLCGIICRWPKEAEKLVNDLRKIGFPSVRLGHRDQFDFSPGITITNVHQVKGLEFRNVLIVEADEKNYNPESEDARNLLYVAVTRAELRLDFVGVQPLTSLLPELDSEESNDFPQPPVDEDRSILEDNDADFEENEEIYEEDQKPEEDLLDEA